MDMLTKGIGLGLEPLSCNDTVPIDYEQTLFQVLVNEGKHIRVLNAKRPQFSYNEKQLRDAAAAEVAVHGLYGNEDLGDKSSRKRKHMNADEKAKQNRDRNREHAKNTRLRKKAYVVKLKELVDQMNGQKDMEEKERRALGERVHDTHIIRKNAVRLMLSYRAANVRDREKWVAILDEGFVFTLPITPYRSFHKGDIVSSSRVIVGVDAAIADAASLALMVESVGLGTEQWKDAVKRGQSCRISYSSSKEDMLAAGDLIMCRYVMRTEGFDTAGALSPCVQHGMLQCRFNKQNKMVGAEMMFDVMGFMQQLQRASAISPENSIVPNTIDMALQPSREARAIIKAEPPFAIMHINEPWTALSGLSQAEAEGRPLSDSLRLHSSQEEQMYALAADCSIGSAGSAILMTHSRSAQGEPALIYLKLFPLTGDSDVVSHFMGVQIDLPLTPAERDALLVHCNNTAAASSAAGNSGPQGLSQHRPDQPQQTGYLHQGQDQPHGSIEVQSNEVNRAQGRSHGEMLYQYQQQQYHLHQERISEAQMQQAYYSLSVASQDVHNGQGNGTFEDICAAQVNSEVSGSAASSSSRGGERSHSRRESATSSPQQGGNQIKEEQVQAAYSGHSQYPPQHRTEGSTQGQAQSSSNQRRGVGIGGRANAVDSSSYTSNSNAAYNNYDQPQQDSSSYNGFTNSTTRPGNSNGNSNSANTCTNASMESGVNNSNNRIGGISNGNSVGYSSGQNKDCSSNSAETHPPAWHPDTNKKSSV